MRYSLFYIKNKADPKVIISASVSKWIHSLNTVVLSHIISIINFIFHCTSYKITVLVWVFFNISLYINLKASKTYACIYIFVKNTGKYFKRSKFDCGGIVLFNIDKHQQM